MGRDTRAQAAKALSAAAIVLALAAGEVRAQSAPPTGTADARALSNQVNNPAAPVTLIQFRNVLLPRVEGASTATNEFQIQPVLPIGLFASFPILQLIKITLPFPAAPSPIAASGFGDMGDMQVFDLVSIKQAWGQWGFGLPWSFPPHRTPGWARASGRQDRPLP